MPYKSEKIRIAGTQYDRRIKLTPDQKEYIKWLREKQLISYSKLAKNIWSEQASYSIYLLPRQIFEKQREFKTT